MTRQSDTRSNDATLCDPSPRIEARLGISHRPQIYHTLDGMRGVAAMAVFVLHAQAFWQPIQMPGAFLAVDLFFVLSGFVISHAYSDELSSGMSVRRFICLRIMRLYPLYIAGTLIGIFSAIVAFLLGAGELNATGVTIAALSNIVMMPSPTAQQLNLLYPMNTPGWSLFYELVVNTVFAGLWRTLTKGLLIGIVLASAIALLISIASVGTADLGSTWSTFGFGFPRVFYSFFAGVLIHRWRSGKRVGSDVVAWLCILLPLIAFAIPPFDGSRVAIDTSCVLVIFPVLIYVASSFEPRSDLSANTFAALGLVSFPLYAVHYPVLELMRRAIRIMGWQPSSFAPSAGVLLLCGLTAISVVLARRWDAPIRKSISGRWF